MNVIMKKLLLILLLLPLELHAYDFEFEGCGYKVLSMTERTVELESYLDRELTGDFIVPENIMYADMEFKVTKIGKGAFRYSKLNSITVLNGISEIGPYAFEGCKNLSEFIWPESAETINESTFYDCINLKSVILPSTLKAIKGNIFFNVSGIGSKGAFEHCISLHDIKLPEGLQELDGSTFAYCGSLKSIDLPHSLREISTATFYSSGLNSIDIPDSIISIGNKAFYDCSGLTSATIPNSVREIGDEAFSGCSSLVEVIIPDSSEITKFGYRVFDGTAIAHINMPINLLAIEKAWYDSDYWTFSSKLKSISLPNVINTMNNGCYRNYELEKVYSRNRNPEAISENAFHINTLLNGVLYVPEGMDDIYKSLDGWKLFRNIQEYSPTDIDIISNDTQDSSILYDLSGKRVSENYVSPGLYIKNKRKIILK